MLLGLTGSALTIVLSVAIFAIADDELEDWCERCAFGVDRESKGYRNPAKQLEEFSAAIKVVL